MPPVRRYWADWRSPGAETIRIRDLLRHNSGLPQPDRSMPDADGVPAFYRAAAVAPSVSANLFCAGPLRASAPADYEYNNCDTIVLAEVLARVTGQTFEQLVRQRLAAPLGMRSFGIYDLQGAHPDHVMPNGEYTDVDRLLNLGVYGASGGGYGTIADL